jgi:hypothetical protein
VRKKNTLLLLFKSESSMNTTLGNSEAVAAAAAAAETASEAETPRYIEVDGPIDPESSLITYDVPYAPEDPKKTMKYRQKLGLEPEAREADPNATAVIDNFIVPRQWVDANGVMWLQAASPHPASRIDVVRCREKLRSLIAAQGGRSTGVCPVRTYLYSECFVEMIRQTVAESWERGLLLLKVHAERVMAQKAHRELFETRTGYAFRLALKGEKDTAAMVNRITFLEKRKVDLAQQEEFFKQKCDDFALQSEEAMRLDEKRYTDELNALKKEAYQKKTMLESLTAPQKK